MLKKFLLSIGNNFARDVGLRLLISVAGATTMALLITILYSEQTPVNNLQAHLAVDGLLLGFYLVCIFVPFLENIALGILICSLSRFIDSKLITIAVVALLLAGMHAFVSWRWAFVVLPSFIVMSATFIAYKDKSIMRAYFAIFCIHFLQNSIAFTAASFAAEKNGIAS